MAAAEAHDLIGAEAASRMAAAEVAMGEAPADLILTNGRVVDVYTGRVLEADVAIAGDRIASVGDVRTAIGTSTRELDCAGRYVLPGFVEPHLHIGSSQLTIERLAEVLVPRGTVALSTCFYEPALVSGVTAAEELVDRSVGTGLDVLLSPFLGALGAGPLGESRASIDDLHRLVAHPRCVELRELSIPNSRIPGMDALWEDALRRKVVIGGHLEGLRGDILQASVALGVCNDHETATAEEALEKARSGVIVQAREGSAARDLVQIVRAITEHGAPASCFAFSTDEQELDSLVHDGHMDHKLRLAVREGVSPIDAVRMATLGGARSLGVERNYGAVAAGRVASLVLVEDLAQFQVTLVLAQGQLAGEDHTYLLEPRTDQYPNEWTRTVHLAHPLTPEDLELRGSGLVRVIGVTPGSLITAELHEQVEPQELRLGAESGLAKIAVADRHQASGRIGVGLIRGLDITDGAVATTINPGMANLMVLGTDDEAMALAANRVADLNGGIVVAHNGSVAAEVALPVFGMLSHEPLQQTVHACERVAQAIREQLGCPYDGMLSTAGFACLPVAIPSLKICERGLVKVDRVRGGGIVPLGIDRKKVEASV
jgi:adenine deaminase